MVIRSCCFVWHSPPLLSLLGRRTYVFGIPVKVEFACTDSDKRDFSLTLAALEEAHRRRQRVEKMESENAFLQHRKTNMEALRVRLCMIIMIMIVMIVMMMMMMMMNDDDDDEEEAKEAKRTARIRLCDSLHPYSYTCS